ncbi:MAG: cupin domain-containing protein [Planctomycetota bacterium]
MDPRINFAQMEWLEWIEVGTARMKTVIVPGSKLRLIEFEPGFEQLSWCSNGHLGYVAEGEMETVIGEQTTVFKKGDALVIQAGMRHRSRNIGTTPVLLFLVDELDHGSDPSLQKALQASPPAGADCG